MQTLCNPTRSEPVMFEFHGWASVRYHTHDIDWDLQTACWKRILKLIDGLEAKTSISARRGNGVDVVQISGQHNHYAAYVLGLFQGLAELAPGSYGLLYVHDDEDLREGQRWRNHFRVWRLCRGQLTEHDDSFLSPFVPTVEDPDDESRGD